jgi:hypothetical protein
MELNDIVILIFGAILWFAFGQMEASGNIGVRSYSVWYSTHFLIEKKGICKLIYFKPKHFERYTLYEVITFFASYVSLVVFIILSVLGSLEIISSTAIKVSVTSSSGLILLSQLVIVLINDIGSHRDEKKRFYLESGERETISPIPESLLPKDNKLMSKVIQLSINSRNNTYFTTYNLWDSYHVRLKEAGKDIEKRNKVNLDYIKYFRNIDYLIVIKENKSGSLQLKIQK